MRKPSAAAAATLLFLIAVGSSHAQATSDEKITFHYEKQDEMSVSRMRYDLSKIDLTITNIQVLSMDDTPRYKLDDADLVKITVSVTNNGHEHFVLLDKMFELWIMSPSKSDPASLEHVDSYDTTYDDEFEVMYEEMNSRELFNECDQTIKSAASGKQIEFTLCYNILKVRNEGGVKMDGQKKYMLVMMDNQQAGSCPNCKKIMLTDDEPKRTAMPMWIQRLFEWKDKGLISETELRNSLNYLARFNAFIGADPKDESDIFLSLKNKELAKYQDVLAKAYSRNVFVSAIGMFESKHSDGFTGIICKRQNDVVTLDADYTNEDIRYGTIFFRLKIYDNSGNVTAEGLSKIVDVAPKSYRHVSVSTPSVHNIRYCEVRVDSKFS